MPNIKPFDTPALSLRPSETGVESTAGAARRVGAFYNQEAGALEQLGSETANLGAFEGSLITQTGARAGSALAAAGDAYVNFEDHKEISHGVATFASLQDDITQKWNEVAKNADPNDPSVAAKFRETVLQPALDNFQGAFSTERAQQWAQGHAEALTTLMDHKMGADMSTLAGIAAKKNIQDAATHMSNTAITDPSQVPFLLESIDHSIGGMVSSSPTLSATDAARVKAEVSEVAKANIVKYGAIGAIQKSSNPEATADEWIKKYPDYINGAEAKMLAANARQQIRAANYDYEIGRRRQKEIATDRSNEATAQYLIDVRSQDPKLANDPTAKKILNDPTLTNAAKSNLLNYIDRQLKPETDSRISQQTFVGLLREMRQPNADTDAIMQKAWDARVMDPGKTGSLSERDFNQFREEVIARKTPEGAALERDRSLFFKQYAGAIAGAGYDLVVGSPKLYQAEMDARRMEATLRQKGLDPHLAYDPASEYFLGRNERLQKWQSSMQVDLQSRAEVATPAPGKAAKPEVPFELRGVADLQYSRSRNQWRDNASGKIYNADGSEAK